MGAWDIECGVIFLPDSKTGRKPVYLSEASLAILASLPRVEGNPFVIPGTKPGQPRSDLKKPWAAVTKAAGLEGLRLHDLRHSFASVGAGASRFTGHREAARAHLTGDDGAICAPRCRSDTASRRNHGQHDRGRVEPKAKR